MRIRLLCVLLLLTACSRAADQTPDSQTTGNPGPRDSVTVTETTDETTVVARVIDGDTVEIDNGEIVRVIGIDTPETKHPSKPIECYGPEASAYAERTLLGRHVRLEGNQTDRYGRRLAHLWLVEPSGETSYGLEALKTGHAVRYRDAWHQYESLFIDAEAQARDTQIGLWGACP